MAPRIHTTFGRLILVIFLVALIQDVALAQRGGRLMEATARRKFQEQKYDEAIEAYRQYLRRHPKDYDAWNQIGAAYYHTGLPKRALRYLKQVQRKTINRSYNYYYQGLCYVAIGNFRRAREYFSFVSSRYTDEYSARATFEHAVLEYKQKDAARARYFAQLYLQRFPNGVYRAQANQLLSNLQYGIFNDSIQGSPKPDMEAALYKYNSLSLFDYPHFWYAQFGYRYEAEIGKEPAPGGQLKDRQTDDHGAIANVGIGAGPLREGKTTGFVGYAYRQLWITDNDRLTEFANSLDPLYFPLRADLLERRHQMFGDFRYDLAESFYLGVFGRYELARIGSELFPSPDPEDFQVSQTIANTLLAIPWIGVSYFDHYRTLFYLYIRQQINEESPEHNNKTFDFGGPLISWGISHSMDFPDYDLNVGIEFFNYTFIYNDYWLDYDRIGAIVSAEHELIPSWNVQALVGLYEDTYITRQPKTGGCKTIARNEGEAAPNPNVVRLCPRSDAGMLYQAGMYYNWTQFRRFAAYAQLIENGNPSLKEYDVARQSFWLTFTYAFPSVKRVERFVDRFADSAFTKEAE